MPKSNSKRILINTSTKEKLCTLNENHIEKLLQAKTKDCEHEPNNNQKEILHLYIAKYCYNNRLNLNNLSLGIESTKVIASLIRYDIRVTKLNLSSNNIKDDGA